MCHAESVAFAPSSSGTRFIDLDKLLDMCIQDLKELLRTSLFLQDPNKGIYAQKANFAFFGMRRVYGRRHPLATTTTEFSDGRYLAALAQYHELQVRVSELRKCESV